MYLCYIDESGTANIPGNTSHFVLAGLSIPIWHWKAFDREIQRIKRTYAIEDAEIHTAWMLRRYLEQDRIPGFEQLPHHKRRSAVTQQRTTELLRLQRSGNAKRYRQAKKNFNKTGSYVHLAYQERRAFINEVAACVGNWGTARLFAECIDKVHFDPSRRPSSVGDQAFEQVVSRFQHYLGHMESPNGRCYGLLIHDNNETVAKQHTELMKRYLDQGTLWTDLANIIETPLFVDSELTSMVQIADLCAYGLRRYLENQETELFDLVFPRADRHGDVVVGVRHFTSDGCPCRICAQHRRN